MSNSGRDAFRINRLHARVLCCVALLGCTDIETLKDQLASISDGGVAGTGAFAGTGAGSGSGGGTGGVGPSLAMGGMGGEQAAGSMGNALPPQAGTSPSAAGQGAAGTIAACVPGNDGCLCAGTVCNGALVCANGTCRPVVCGDAVQDPAEECDDGNTADSDACTAKCLHSRCGDGVVRVDTEQCDDANSVDGDSCSNACEKHYNIAFVTSTTYTVSTLGGITGADAACATRAAAAGLSGNFLAWLNTTSMSISDRFSGARAWVRPDGKPFLDEVGGGATFYPPSINELGDAVSKDGPPAAGGYASGESGSECADWTSEASDQYYMDGDPTSGAWYGGWSSTQCSTPFRLYCLQHDFSNVLTFEYAEGRLAFVSNTPWYPEGGLTGADARCNQDALDAGLWGTFKALLATSSASAASRFSTSGGTWVRRDGIPIVAQAQDLFVPGGMLLAPLQLTAFGSYLVNYGGWSGSSDPNQIGIATCNDWTSSADSVMGTSGRVLFGNVHDMLGYDDDEPCSSQYTHLYCLEDP